MIKINEILNFPALFSMVSRIFKVRFFLKKISPGARVLEIGSGSGWVGEYLKKKGCMKYSGIDLLPPADIVGDIRDWKSLGLDEKSFDYIIAFEVLEHVDCIKDCYALLKPGGRLMFTTPIPFADRFLEVLENTGLNQKRTGPHWNLQYMKNDDLFSKKILKYPFLLSQWGIYTR